MGTELKPGEDLGAVDPAVKNLDMLSHGKHAAKTRNRLLDTPRGSQRTVESDLVVYQSPHPLDVIALPGVEVGGCDASRRFN